MNEGGSAGGRGPSSIKPPTIKPPTLHDEELGATSLAGAAREPASYRGAPTAQAMPPAYAPSPVSAAPSAPRRQNVLLWVVIAALLLGFLVVVLAVLAIMLLR